MGEIYRELSNFQSIWYRRRNVARKQKKNEQANNLKYAERDACDPYDLDAMSEFPDQFGSAYVDSDIADDFVTDILFVAGEYRDEAILLALSLSMKYTISPQRA